jgi:hypothetical protein
MGLLDMFNSDEGRLGIGLLSAAGPRADGAGFGQRLQEAMTGFQAQKDADMKRKYLQAQMDNYPIDQQLQRQLQQAQIANFNSEVDQRKAAIAKQAAEQADLQLAGQTAQKFFRQGSPAMGAVGGVDASLPADLRTGMSLPPQAAVPPSFDMQSFAAARMGQNPAAGMALMQALQKELPVDKIDPKSVTPASLAKFAVSRNYGDLVPRDKLEVSEGVLFNPWDAKMAGRTLPNPNKAFALDAAGQVVPNTAYQNYEINKAKAGAASTSVKVENKMGEGVASQIGPMLRDSYTAANGAAQTADAAGRIIKALDSGQVIAGPLANQRLQLSQIGQLLGVTGKDSAETIARSRDVIRGLAEMTLQGRKQMSGQGAITESESKLAEKATSGDVTDLTPAEIKQLARASARAAKFVYNQHQQSLGNLSADPNTAGLAKFYKPMPFTDVPGTIADGLVDFGSLR